MIFICKSVNFVRVTGNMFQIVLDNDGVMIHESGY